MKLQKRAATVTLHWLLLFLVTPLGSDRVTSVLEWTFAIAGVLALNGLVTGAGMDMAICYHILLWTMIFHAIYYLFRNPVLGDGALRRMTPRSTRRHL